MIQVHSLHHNQSNSERSVRSHILTPHDTVTVFCIVDGTKESIVSIVEDHILESISSTEWSVRQVQDDFTYITESYNAFIANLPNSDVADIRVLLGVLIGDTITLSTLGGSEALLVERTGSVTDISVHENKGHHFQAVSSGKIPPEGTIYLSNDILSHILGDEVLSELASLPPDTWNETGNRILEREVGSSVHIIRISNKDYDAPIRRTHQNNVKQSSLLREKGAVVAEYFRSKKMWERTKGIIHRFPILQKGKYQYAFLLVGILLLFILGYMLVSSMMSVINNQAPDSKNQLIQAKVLVDEGEKLLANPQAFNTKISEAEKLLFDLRKDQTHTKQTQELLSRIASMKKEAYGIQSVDMSQYSSIIPFNVAEVNPIGIFEKNNKLNLIGKDGSILNYTRGEKETKVIKYPTDEAVRDFDVSDEGTIYALTNNKRILTAKRDTFSYVNVIGQPSWEDALAIRTYNGNIYLLDTTKSQIQRHRPGVNGFSQKSSILTKEIPGIFNFSLNVGIYLYTEDEKIYKYNTATNESRAITLNKIPGEWGINTALKSTFITKSNLSYIYILNGNKIWIFQPDSKRFQDVQSWTYINQLELQTTETPVSIDVPRDGVILMATDKGAYELKFEVIDGKVIFK